MRYDISYVLEQSWLTHTLREKITTMGNTNIFAQYPLERSIYANIHTHMYIYIYLSYILKILYRCNLWPTHYSFKVLHMRASKITHTIRAFLVTVCTHTDSCVCCVCVCVYTICQLYCQCEMYCAARSSSSSNSSLPHIVVQLLWKPNQYENYWQSRNNWLQLLRRPMRTMSTRWISSI